MNEKKTMSSESASINVIINSSDPEHNLIEEQTALGNADVAVPMNLIIP